MTKLKISEQVFKQYLLERYIDDVGRKNSDRSVWGDKDFFEHTGMFSINKYTKERQMLSTGTISYWKKKLNLREEDVFMYHKQVTKRIPEDVEFEDWSRKNNKGYAKESTYNRDTVKRKLISYAGLPKKYQLKSLDELVMIVLKTWQTLGLDAESEITKFYNSV